jgi:HAMP domain-containing protein
VPAERPPLHAAPPRLARPVRGRPSAHALAQSGIALAVMAALAFALGWLVAGRVLRPVRTITITATARAISATSLHERLPLTEPDDEFTELAATLNDLLARLEASFTAQRHFVANASHELRTPLTLDRTLLQLALRNPHMSVEQWCTTGQELLESGQQQERLLEALLTLATSEGGISNREPADLSEAAAASLHATCPEADRQRVRVETSLHPAPVLGDPHLIERRRGRAVRRRPDRGNRTDPQPPCPDAGRGPHPPARTVTAFRGAKNRDGHALRSGRHHSGRQPQQRWTADRRCLRLPTMSHPTHPRTAGGRRAHPILNFCRCWRFALPATRGRRSSSDTVRSRPVLRCASRSSVPP